MGRTIKTRHIQKDIKVLDKTVTAAEHMKGAYIRTRDSAEQTQVKEQGNPVGYAEDQVMEKGERAARGTIQQAEKQGKKVIHAVREKGRTEKEAEAFREKNGDPSASSYEEKDVSILECRGQGMHILIRIEREDHKSPERRAPAAYDAPDLLRTLYTEEHVTLKLDVLQPFQINAICTA